MCLQNESSFKPNPTSNLPPRFKDDSVLYWITYFSSSPWMVKTKRSWSFYTSEKVWRRGLSNLRNDILSRSIHDLNFGYCRLSDLPNYNLMPDPSNADQAWAKKV